MLLSRQSFPYAIVLALTILSGISLFSYIFAPSAASSPLASSSLNVDDPFSDVNSFFEPPANVKRLPSARPKKATATKNPSPSPISRATPGPRLEAKVVTVPPVIERSMKSTPPRTLVLYSYFEKNDEYVTRLSYFLDVAVTPDPSVDYLFIVQGHTVLEASLLAAQKKHSNVFVFLRDNTCYDYGSYGAGLDHMAVKAHVAPKAVWMHYKYFVFINPSVVGPLLPSYWPSNLHWTTIFTSKINARDKMVGAAIACLPPEDLGGRGPKIEGYAWATDNVGLWLLKVNDNFRCFTSKPDVIVNGEYLMSRIMLKAGYNLQSLLLAQRNTNWLDERTWKCNDMRHATRFGQYSSADISVHPLEVVFHKVIFEGDEKNHELVYATEAKQYQKWIIDQVRRDASAVQASASPPQETKTNAAAAAPPAAPAAVAAAAAPAPAAIAVPAAAIPVDGNAKSNGDKLTRWVPHVPAHVPNQVGKGKSVSRTVTSRSAERNAEPGEGSSNEDGQLLKWGFD